MKPTFANKLSVVFFMFLGGAVGFVQASMVDGTVADIQTHWRSVMLGALFAGITAVVHLYQMGDDSQNRPTNPGGKIPPMTGAVVAVFLLLFAWAGIVGGETGCTRAEYLRVESVADGILEKGQLSCAVVQHQSLTGIVAEDQVIAAMVDVCRMAEPVATFLEAEFAALDKAYPADAGADHASE